jgi:hypothetical protein
MSISPWGVIFILLGAIFIIVGFHGSQHNLLSALKGELLCHWEIPRQDGAIIRLPSCGWACS